MAIAEQLDLLPQIYGRVLIPTAVATELQRGSEDESRIATALSQDWLEAGFRVSNPLYREVLRAAGETGE